MNIDSYIGVDIGGTKCAAVLGQNTSSCILGKRSFLTKQYAQPEACTEQLIREIDSLLVAHSGKLRAIGISCGGPLDSGKGIIQSPPNLPGWVDYPIVERFRSRYGVPVVLENDANACAVAEWKFGAGKGFSNIIFLTCGTGFGAGLILDNKLYRGTSGMAGEVGHLRLESFGPVGYGKAGSAEGFCSGAGIAQLGRSIALEAFQTGRKVGYCQEISQLEKITARSVAQAAERNDAAAIHVYEIFARQLGRVLSLLIDLLNPDCIILGSIYQRNEKWLSAEGVPAVYAK